jgi:cytochrome c oxidase cbb3-type subunit III
MTRRPIIALALALLAVGAFAAVLAWVVEPEPPAGAGPGQRLFLKRCATCHGADGRGGWRAALFFIRPGNLADGARMRSESDRYLFDIIKHGGAPIGRPGMPGFEDLTDDDVAALVRYVRSLAR